MHRLSPIALQCNFRSSREIESVRTQLNLYIKLAWKGIAIQVGEGNGMSQNMCPIAHIVCCYNRPGVFAYKFRRHIVNIGL